MSKKRDLQKSTNVLLAKIVEDLMEILECFKKGEGTQEEAMMKLVFSKRRMISLTESAQLIFKNLVELKLQHRSETREIE